MVRVYYMSFNPVNNTVLESKIEYLEHFKLDIKPDEIYSMGVDASTSNTGIFIKNESGTEIKFLEVRNLDMDRYYKNKLFKLMDDIVSNMPLRYLIYERPLEYITHRMNPVLIALYRDFQKFVDTHKCLDKTFTDYDGPVEWRSGFLKNSTNPKREKQSVYLEVIKRYPIAEAFSRMSGSDLDGYEACGVLLGYFDRRELDNNGNGIPLNVGLKKSRFSTVEVFKVYDTVEDFNDEFNFLKKVIKTDVSLKKYNNKEVPNVNAKMAVSKNTVTLVAIPYNVKLNLEAINLWKPKNGVSIAYYIRSNYVTPELLGLFDYRNFGVREVI